MARCPWVQVPGFVLLAPFSPAQHSIFAQRQLEVPCNAGEWEAASAGIRLFPLMLSKLASC